MSTVENKVIAITGASSDIGAATARLLSHQGLPPLLRLISFTYLGLFRLSVNVQHPGSEAHQTCEHIRG